MLQVFDIVGYFILILVLVSIVAVNAGSDMTLTLESLDSLTQKEYVNVTADSGPIVKVVGATIDYIIYISIEVAKAGVVFGTENLHMAPQTIIYLIMLALLTPLIIPAVKLLIIIIILLNEWRIQMKEKRMKKKEIHNTNQKGGHMNNGKIE